MDDKGKIVTLLYFIIASVVILSEVFNSTTILYVSRR
jgi:hypothetical protein